MLSFLFYRGALAVSSIIRQEFLQRYSAGNRVFAGAGVDSLCSARYYLAHFVRNKILKISDLKTS